MAAQFSDVAERSIPGGTVENVIIERCGGSVIDDQCCENVCPDDFS